MKTNFPIISLFGIDGNTHTPYVIIVSPFFMLSPPIFVLVPPIFILLNFLSPFEINGKR
jgi:hypothetical protein